MRTIIQIVTLSLLTLALLLVPCILNAEELPVEDQPQEEQVAEQPTEDATPADDSSTTSEKKETPPPPKTYPVHYDANGGEGEMESTTFVEGGDTKLARCTFTRAGYTFEGWNTSPDGSGVKLGDAADASDVLSQAGITLYAQWGSQLYLIRYNSGVPKKSESPAKGTMPSQLVVHDAEVTLQPCEYKRKGYTAKGWVDQNGKAHEFEETSVNFSPDTDTRSWELATIKADPLEEGTEGHWSCQGSVVYEDDNGTLCAAMAFYLSSTAYNTNGNFDAYDSFIQVVNLDTGEVLKSARGLMLEHANDIAYRPDNKHYYVAQGGLREGYPDGIVELDENLNEVRSITPEGTHNIWNLSYSNGRFYGIANVNGDSFARGNPEGETSDLIVLDQDLNLLETHVVDYSLQGFSGQGMVCDGSFLYSILVNFGEHESSTKQRLAIFTLDGEPRGTQRIDIDTEVESASTAGDHMYFSTNGGDHGTIYGTDLASTTMSVVWEPNPYTIEFDAGDMPVMGVPDSIDTTYDEETPLPSEAPTCLGYDFVGWNTQADGQGTTYQPGENVHNLVASGSVTLYAQWRRVAVGLVADNGSMTTEDSADAESSSWRTKPQPRHFASAVAYLVALVTVLAQGKTARREPAAPTSADVTFA